MSLTRAGSIIQVNISNHALLQECYMPFITGGGLFVASKLDVSIGQEILVIVTLADQPQKFALSSKVVWISPKPNGTKPKGFGIQLAGEKGLELKLLIENQLAGALNVDKATYTM